MEDFGYGVSERRITPFDLINAEEVFMTGTLAEIVPVVRVNGRSIGSGEVGPMTAKIFRESIRVRTQLNEGTEIFPSGFREAELKSPLHHAI